MSYGYYRAAAITLPVEIANPKANAQAILSVLEELDKDISLCVFPELCLSGYTCGDLFSQQLLLNACLDAVYEIAEKTKDGPLLYIGLPLCKDDMLFNCAAVVHKGEILGFIPKSVLPTYGEFYEKRWFSQASDRSDDIYILPDGKQVPFTCNLLIHDEESKAIIGAEICEDAWGPLPPSAYHTMHGANIIVNLSASNETIGKRAYRRDLIRLQSARCCCGYVYACAGCEESTTDVVFSSHNILAENGVVRSEGKFGACMQITSAVFDLERIAHDRIRLTSFKTLNTKLAYTHLFIHSNIDTLQPDEPVEAHPFVPQDVAMRGRRCKEILAMQAVGLAQRLKKIHIKHIVIGISGGLDSTLALLVAIEALQILSLDTSHIVAVTMPGFGTSKRTHTNSQALMHLLQVNAKEISIENACLQHFSDIEHDPKHMDITYENVQARERTQILMDIANQQQAIVLGTGDLSELALGWCTYNGDHMSMYAVNASIPKTLVRYMVEAYAISLTKKNSPYLAQRSQKEREEIASILQDICATPISPELLPPSKYGEIQQLTENNIGSYELHDFFLYHMLRNGFAPAKIYMLAQLAFPNTKKDELLSTMNIFYHRFFTQQFKRSCMPDGIKVGSICLSPRGDWRMPSDASSALWLKQLEELKNKQQ